MQKYEYNQLYMSFKDDGTNHLPQLNTHGLAGWELISAIKIDGHNVCYIFKREIILSEKILLTEQNK